jgi:hypothetical protein
MVAKQSTEQTVEARTAHHAASAIAIKKNSLTIWIHDNL